MPKSRDFLYLSSKLENPIFEDKYQFYCPRPAYISKTETVVFAFKV